MVFLKYNKVKLYHFINSFSKKCHSLIWKKKKPIKWSPRRVENFNEVVEHSPASSLRSKSRLLNLSVANSDSWAIDKTFVLRRHAHAIATLFNIFDQYCIQNLKVSTLIFHLACHLIFFLEQEFFYNGLELTVSGQNIYI